MSDDTWTAERVATLRALWNQAPRLSLLEIARRMGMTKNAIVGKAHRLDLPSRPSPIIRGTTPPRVVEAKAPSPIIRGTTPPRVVEAKAPAPSDAPPPPPVRHGLSPHRACQHIAGEPAGAATLFCGAPAKPGSSYCAAHHALCWIIPPWREAA